MPGTFKYPGTVCKCDMGNFVWIPANIPKWQGENSYREN